MFNCKTYLSLEEWLKFYSCFTGPAPKFGMSGKLYDAQFAFLNNCWETYEEI